jgi:hypothetical protein
VPAAPLTTVGIDKIGPSGLPNGQSNFCSFEQELPVPLHFVWSTWSTPCHHCRSCQGPSRGRGGYRRPTLVHAVHTAVILLVHAPVVDDDVGHALDLLKVKCLKIWLRAILGRAQVIEPTRHVGLLGYRVRWWREPDVGHTHVADVIY